MEGSHSAISAPEKDVFLLMTLHVMVVMRCKVEVETEIKILCIVGNQRNSLQVFDVRVVENTANQP